MRVPYTYLEAEEIERDYNEQVPVKVIVENVNRDFHGGKPVRNENSVFYIVKKMNNDSEWREKLEEKWLETTATQSEVVR